MKRLVVVFITLALLAGFAIADQGINPIFETQGISLATSLNAVGSFDSNSELTWKITDDSGGLGGIPPLEDSSATGSIDVISYEPFQATAQGLNRGATLYTSVYNEKTSSNGVGQIGYTKSLAVETKGRLNGQSNIEATKQIQYIGDIGGRIASDDFIMVDGTANPSPSARFGLAINADVPEPAPLTSDKFICVFAGTKDSSILPAFCNYAESTSSIDMSVANVRTTSDARFIVPSADTPVILSHDIRVTDSDGKASAGMDAMIMESRSYEKMMDFAITMFDPNTCHEYDFEGWVGISSTDVYENIEVSEHTSVDGHITLFDKVMKYDSGAKR